METIEGNKLIAEFMGGKVEKFTWRKYEPMGVTFDKQVHGLQAHVLCDLEYHSSWDWLMPVVEKIRCLATGDNPHNNLLSYKIELLSQAKVFACSISKSYWPKQGEHKEEFICGRRDLTSLVDVTWRAVIKFITWYNNTKK